jgi:hypothetical protein
MRRRDDTLSLEALEDLSAMAEIIGEVALERRPEVLDNEDTRWRLEQAVEHSQERERARRAPVRRRPSHAVSLLRSDRWPKDAHRGDRSRPAVGIPQYTVYLPYTMIAG